ncbi:type II toxin-antitoxin system Phd/YefM family antitoxin [Geomonas edaphica]|uniref:type II toxin-antitoxin system Phd/YefM family antitoxin n=1 Tax=Geomonas edaphica TaxID=2570226 RepID=UPI0010A87BBA|nr:type II toxin-antitoxin system prevent-host-death family antitoxin [Geomonas edaphica]
MIKVNVTQLRNNLTVYLGKVKAGEEVALTSRGKVIARLVPEVDEAREARMRLEAARKDSWVGDVVSPIEEAWEVESGAP